MNKITIEQATAIVGASLADGWMEAANQMIKKSQRITAEEARKLGAGNAEWFDDAFNQWKLCTPDICNYYPYFKYRAINQDQLASLPDELIDPEAKKALGEWIDSQQPEPVDHIELLGEIYVFLQSICPEGIADEAFRIVPEAIRAQAIAKYVEPSNALGERVRHTQEAGRAEVDILTDSCPMFNQTKESETK